MQTEDQFEKVRAMFQKSLKAAQCHCNLNNALQFNSYSFFYFYSVVAPVWRAHWCQNDWSRVRGGWSGGARCIMNQRYHSQWSEAQGPSILSFFMADSKTWTLRKRPAGFISSMDYQPKPNGDSPKNRVVGSSCYWGRLPHWFVINTSHHTLFFSHHCQLFCLQVGQKLAL